MKRTLAPDASLLESELQQAIEEAIQRLAGDAADGARAAQIRELSYEQIADVLDLSVPAVKSVLFRARTELRSRLTKYLDRSARTAAQWRSSSSRTRPRTRRTSG